MADPLSYLHTRKQIARKLTILPKKITVPIIQAKIRPRALLAVLAMPSPMESGAFIGVGTMTSCHLALQSWKTSSALPSLLEPSLEGVLAIGVALYGFYHLANHVGTIRAHAALEDHDGQGVTVDNTLKGQEKLN